MDLGGRIRAMFNGPEEFDLTSGGIGTRVFSVIVLPAIAVARGVETMTGQNPGAGEPDRAERAAALAATVLFGLLTASGVVVFFVAPSIADVFTTDLAAASTDD